MNNRFKQFLIILPLISVCIVSKAQRYDDFLQVFVKQYQKDSRIRGTDSLQFVSKIMNYENWDIKDIRAQLFEMLKVDKPKLVYPFAVDLRSGSVYRNPNGDLLLPQKEKIRWFKEDTMRNHPAYNQWMSSLIRYLRNNPVDHIFSIENIIDLSIPCDLFWIIRNKDISVIRYNLRSDLFDEYDAEEYLEKIAEDDVLSPSIRLRKYLNEFKTLLIINNVVIKDTSAFLKVWDNIDDSYPNTRARLGPYSIASIKMLSKQASENLPISDIPDGGVCIITLCEGEFFDFDRLNPQPVR